MGKHGGSLPLGICKAVTNQFLTGGKKSVAAKVRKTNDSDSSVLQIYLVSW